MNYPCPRCFRNEVITEVVFTGGVFRCYRCGWVNPPLREEDEKEIIREEKK